MGLPVLSFCPDGERRRHPSGQNINSFLLGTELVVPITKRLKFSGELAYGQALGLEFFRYGQDRNLGTGKEIRTVVGWGELDYAHDDQTRPLLRDTDSTIR